METMSQVFMWVGVVVTFSSTIVLALEKVAEVTPTTKDDRYIGKAKVILSYVSTLLDNFNVYTTKDKK